MEYNINFLSLSVTKNVLFFANWPKLKAFKRLMWAIGALKSQTPLQSPIAQRQIF